MLTTRFHLFTRRFRCDAMVNCSQKASIKLTLNQFGGAAVDQSVRSIRRTAVTLFLMVALPTYASMHFVYNFVKSIPNSTD